jgi:hypothetical protein
MELLLVLLVAWALLSSMLLVKAGRQARSLEAIHRGAEAQSEASVAAAKVELVSLRQRLATAERALADADQEARRLRADFHQERQDSSQEVAAALKAARGDAAAADTARQRIEAALKERLEGLAMAYVKDSLRFIVGVLTANNYESSRKRLERTFETCGRHGAERAGPERESVLAELRMAYEAEVRKSEARAEQQRIKERIREEQREERLREEELRRLDREQKALEVQLERALKSARDEHSAEVERLRGLLADAEARNERAKSMAQLTRAGFVYVISNIGSFGDEVFKVGMTRRLEPMERVAELGDASVPFPFDVHMMISCEDAPGLEAKLHQELNGRRLNRVNLRKEYFRVDLDSIVRLVEQHHGTVEYVATAEALEYQESRLLEAREQSLPYDPASEVDEDVVAA